MKKHFYIRPTSQEKDNAGRIVYDEFTDIQNEKFQAKFRRVNRVKIRLYKERYYELKLLASLERLLAGRCVFYSDESLHLIAANDDDYTSAISHFFNYLWNSKLFISSSDIENKLPVPASDFLDYCSALDKGEYYPDPRD